MIQTLYWNLEIPGKGLRVSLTDTLAIDQWYIIETPERLA